MIMPMVLLVFLARSESDCFLYGTEFQFYNIGVLADISSSKSCAEACHESDSCNFATYYEDRAVCHLKSKSLPVPREHATSVEMQCLYPRESFEVAHQEPNHTDLGSLDRSPTDIIMKDVCFQMDILYSGGDMSNRHAKNKETCVIYCYMRDGCTIMSFETSSGLCYFKNGGERTPLVGTISAGMECFPIDQSTTTTTTSPTPTTVTSKGKTTTAISTLTSPIKTTTMTSIATASAVGGSSTKTITPRTTTEPTTTSYTTRTSGVSRTVDPVVIIINGGGGIIVDKDIVVHDEQDDVPAGAGGDHRNEDDDDDDRRFPQTTQEYPWSD